VTLLDWLYTPAQFIAGRPERALAGAACFAIAAVILRIAKRRAPALADRPAILCTALWVFWGINEHAAKLYGWNIRIDTVFLWPILAIVTLACIGLTLASIAAAVRGTTNGSGAGQGEAVRHGDTADTEGR
jgi:predicted membrane protein